jgi:hypothetical protein
MNTERDDFKMNTRKSGLFWPIAVLLVVTSIGIAWVGFPLLTQRSKPKPIPAAETKVNPLDLRLTAAEQKLAEWLKESPELMARVDKVEKNSRHQRPKSAN